MALSPWPEAQAEIDAAVAVLEAALPDGAPAARLGPVAAAMTENFAANAPESVKSESVIRVCAWLFQRSPGVRAQSVRLGGAVALGKHLFGGDRRVIQFGREEPVSAMARSPRGSDSVKSWWPFQRRVERRGKRIFRRDYRTNSGACRWRFDC